MSDDFLIGFLFRVRLCRLGGKSFLRFQALIPILTGWQQRPDLILRISPFQQQIPEFITGFDTGRVIIQAEIDFGDIIPFLQKSQHWFRRKTVQRDIALLFPILWVHRKKSYQVDRRLEYEQPFPAAAPAKAIVRIRAGYRHAEALRAAGGGFQACRSRISTCIRPYENNVVVPSFLINQPCIHECFHDLPRKAPCFQQVGKQSFHISCLFGKGECCSFSFFIV